MPRIYPVLGAPGHCTPTVTTLILMFFVLVLPLAAPLVSAQLRVGNLSQSQVLPQCQAQCDAYNVMNTQCNAVGVFDITYIYCECTPTNFGIIEDCFNCQAVNATQETEMQELLDDIVDECNNKITAPGSTVSISSQQIVPSPTASSTNGASRLKPVGAGLFALGLAVILGA